MDALSAAFSSSLHRYALQVFVKHRHVVLKWPFRHTKGHRVSPISPFPLERVLTFKSCISKFTQWRSCRTSCSYGERPPSAISNTAHKHPQLSQHNNDTSANSAELHLIKNTGEHAVRHVPADNIADHVGMTDKDLIAVLLLLYVSSMNEVPKRSLNSSSIFVILLMAQSSDLNTAQSTVCTLATSSKAFFFTRTHAWGSLNTEIFNYFKGSVHLPRRKSKCLSKVCDEKHQLTSYYHCPYRVYSKI